MKNVCVFEIKGLNHENLFNDLSSKVKIYSINRVSKSNCYFSVSIFNAKLVERILVENGFKILSKKKFGILHKLIKICSSYGLILGIGVSALFFAISSFFILNFKVVGVNSHLQSEIIRYIKIVNGFKFKNQVDTNSLENLIFNKFNNLSFVSVSIVGQTMIVNVKQELVPDEMSANFEPILSKYNGVITSINLFQGTANVEVGDIVQQGDVLIFPYILTSDNQKMFVKPMGEVFADVWLSESITHNSCYQTKVYTGNKTVENQIFLFGLKIFEKLDNKKFNDAEIVESDKILIQNNILPFKIHKIITYEQQEKTITQNFDEVEDKIKQKVRENALQKLCDYEIIVKEETFIKEFENLTTVTHIVTVNREIGDK